MKGPVKLRISYILEHGILAFLALTAVCFIFLVAATVINDKFWPLLLARSISCVIACACFGTYFLLKTARSKQWLFAFSVLSVAIHVAITHNIYIHQEWTIVVPFFGLKLLAIAAALAAPAISLPAFIAFATIIVVPFAQYYMWTPFERAWVGPEEPWITIGFVLATQFIWHSRRTGIELTRHKAALAAQNEVFKNFAILLLGAQHLMNSPLQTIAANIRLIELENPGAAERIRAIDRAFATVQSVGEIISFGDKYIRWNDSDLPTDPKGFSKMVNKLVQKMNEPQA